MGTRLELQTELLSLMPEDSKNVYHKPPSNLTLQYPCIVYAQNDEDVDHADNKPYRRVKRWEIKIIDRDPDSVIPDLVASLPMSSWNRAYKAENLNHTVYNLFF